MLGSTDILHALFLALKSAEMARFRVLPLFTPLSGFTFGGEIKLACDLFYLLQRMCNKTCVQTRRDFIINIIVTPM